MSDWVLAIDFGTTSTAAAIKDGESVERIELDGAPRMPSMVFWRESPATGRAGRLVVGQEAEELSGVAPWCLERTPKRRIGDEVIRLGDKELRVVEVVATVLRRVAGEALALRGGDPPAQVRLTHPVRWSRVSLEKFYEAAILAGLPSPAFVPEPVAAATHFASARLDPGGYVAVYDLGGGTFDTAVLERTEDSFELAGAPGGNEHLGGEDFDDRLYRYLGRQLAQDKWRSLHESTERVWMQANRELLRNARRTKEFLSRSAQYEFYMSPPIDQELVASAETFRELIVEDVQSTVTELERTVRAAGLEPGQLAAIYLAGGSSRIPLIGRTIEQRLGLKPQTWDDPKAVTVLGAARLRTAAAIAAEAPTPPRSPALARDTAVTPETAAAPTATAAPALGAAAAPREERRPAPSFAVVAFIVALLSVAAGVVGYVIAPKPAAARATFTGGGRAFAGPLNVSWPTGWRQVHAATTPAKDPTIRSTIDLVPTAGSQGELILGTDRTDPSALLPVSLLNSLSHEPHPDVVGLGPYQYYRYRIVLSESGAAAETVYALPTSGKTVLGYCVTSAASVIVDCEGILGTLSLSGLQVLPVGANATYAAQLSSIMLQTRGAIEAAHLPSAANATDQASAAAAIGRAYQAAAAAAGKLQSGAGPAAAVANRQLVTALGALGRAYGDLGAAAGNGDSSAYVAAARAITNGNAAAGEAFGRLAAAGYVLA